MIKWQVNILNYTEKISNNKKNLFIEILYILIVFSNTLLTYAIPYQNITLERIASRVILCSALALFAICFFYSSVKYSNTKVVFGVILLCISTLITLLLNGINYDLIIKTLCYLSMSTVWYVMFFIGSKRIKKIIEISYTVQALIIILLFFGPYAYKPFVDINYVTVSDLLTLGFPNPNHIAIIIFSVIVVMFYFTVNKKGYVKVIYSLVIIFLSYMIYLTKSRTSLFCLIVFYCLYFYFKRDNRQRSYKINKSLIFLILISSLIFCLLYLLAFDKGLKDVQLFGKNFFSGREELYRLNLNELKNNYLFGAAGITMFNNAHNGMLAILVNTGIIGTIAYIYVSFNALTALSKKIEKNRNRLAVFVGILSLFILASGEAAVLTGGSMFYCNMLTMCVLCSIE